MFGLRQPFESSMKELGRILLSATISGGCGDPVQTDALHDRVQLAGSCPQRAWDGDAQV